MAIDPNIALQAGAPNHSMGNAMNMLQAAMAFKGAQLNQNALQQQITANQAASEAYKQATDPQTGRVDYNKLTALLANSPAAYNLPQIQAQIATQQNQQLENQSKQFELAQKQVNWMKSGLAPMLNKQDLTSQDVLRFAATGIQHGLLTPEQVATELQSMPNDPGQLREWVKGHYIQSLNSEAQLQAIMPQIQMVNTGPAQAMVNTNPLAGGVGQVQASFQNGMAPGEAATPVQAYDPNTGAPVLITKGQFAGQAGTPQAGGMGDGRYPGGGSTSGLGAGGIGVQSGPAIGQQAGAEVMAKGGAERFNRLQEDASNVQTTVQGYDRALEALDALGKSGPAVDNMQHVSAILESIGMPVSADQNANWQSLKKYLANAASSAASAAGYSGSDARMSSFAAGQPDPTKMNPQALREAIQYVKAQQIGVLAKQSAAQAFLDSNGGDVSKFSTWETKWNKAYSPDAMYLRSLPEGERGQFYNSLPPAKQKALRESYNQMDSLGAW